ncbi:unnamed protein product, partial [Prorocentrum cordatum]
DDPQVVIGASEGHGVPIKRSIAELYIRVFSHMPIDEVIERKNSKSPEDSHFRQQVQQAETSWANRANRTALDTVGLTARGDSVSVDCGSVVKVKRKVAVLNKADFKYYHDGHEPLQRLVRHHPTMLLPVRGGAAGETEKVWLFELFPGARRTMSFATFHKVTAGAHPVRPDDVFYDGQVLDFLNSGLSNQKTEFDSELVAKDLPCISATRGKLDLAPIKLHTAEFRRFSLKSPGSGDNEASPGGPDDDTLDDAASLAASTALGVVSTAGGDSSGRSGPYKHIKNLDCETEMVKGNLGNFLHHASRWLRENGTSPKWSAGVQELKAQVKKFEMAHIASVAHQDNYGDDELAKAVRYLIQIDGALPDAVNLKLCMRAARRMMSTVRDADTFKAFFECTLPHDPGHAAPFDSCSPVLSALEMDPEIKITAFNTCFVDSWLCPAIEAGKGSHSIVTAAIAQVRAKIAEIVASDMPEARARLFCSLTEVFGALNVLIGDGVALSLEEFNLTVKHRIALLSDAKPKDPIAQPVARTVLSVPYYMDMLTDLSKTSRGLNSMGPQVDQVHNALATDLPEHSSPTEEWCAVFNDNALVAKRVLGSMAALGSSFGESVKTQALHKAQALVQAFGKRVAEGRASLEEAKCFGEMVSYQRVAWHEVPFFLEAEGDAAEPLVKLQSEGEMVKFKAALQESAVAESLTQEVLDGAKSAMEKVRGVACADQDAMNDLKKVADGRIKIAVDAATNGEVLRSSALGALAAALGLLPKSSLHDGVLDALRKQSELAAQVADFKAKHFKDDSLDLGSAYQKLSDEKFPGHGGTAFIKQGAMAFYGTVRPLIDEVAEHGLREKIHTFVNTTVAELKQEQGGLKNGAEWTHGLVGAAADKRGKARAVGKSTLLAEGVAVVLRKK